jgi:hypothetical protein
MHRMRPHPATSATRFVLSWLLALLLFLSAPFACAKTYVDNFDGTVTDPTTGLTWMRCAMGQTWTGSTCTGEARTYTYDQANALTGTVTFAGQSDWRLPNIRELQTIVDRSVYSPSIDSTAFPNTPSEYFWSGSLWVGDSNAVWVVYFHVGFAYYNFRSELDAARLVRGGQSFGSLLGLTRPTSDYIDNGNGTVTHTSTNLTWKRCAEGQTWTGSTCTGEARAYTYEQAKALSGTTFADESDWRVPTVDELVTLVDYSIASPGPTINSSIFPATSNSFFWSGSPYASYSGYAWDVSFHDGGVAYDYRSVTYGNIGNRSYPFAVRLVRVGQFFATLPVCTLSANPVVVAAGASTTLTVNCTPAATSYVWTNSGLGTGMVNGKVSPVQTTRYYVKGVNAAGTGDTASAAVYVCNTAPGDNYPGITFSGTAAADVVASTLGADFMDGSAGIDTVIYQCNRSSFTVTRTAAGWTVSSQAEGEDTLSNVERLRFGDETLALDISGNAGKAYRLYQAAFDRKPDNDGLKYWIAQLDAGMGLQEVAARFIDSDEFRQLYGTNPNNAGFLTRLYNNVLHRTPDAGGYAWWLDQLNTGAHTQTTALMGFSESPENQASVLGAILNGIDLLN